MSTLTRTHAAMTEYKAPWAGASKRSIADKLDEVCSLLDWTGVDRTGTHDNTLLINNAIGQAITAGVQLVLPSGTLYCAGGLMATTTSTDDWGRRFMMRGQGKGLTRIRSAAGGAALSLTGAAGGSGMHGYAKLSDFSLESTNVLGNGIFVENHAFSVFSRLRVYGFYRGWYLRDTLSSSLEDVETMWCHHGMAADRKADGDGYHSGPNNLDFRHVTFGNISYTGVTLDVGATLNYDGGSMENIGYAPGGEGTPADRWALRLNSMGLEGSAGCTVKGVYFEGNRGWADIWIDQQANDSAYSIQGNTFNRIGDPVNTYVWPDGTPTPYPAHTPGGAPTMDTAAPNIPHDVNPNWQKYTASNIKVTAQSARQVRLGIRDNGFKGLSAYVENAARPYFSIQENSPNVHYVQDGNFFGDPTLAPCCRETPSFKAANSYDHAGPNGVQSQVLFNSVSWNEGAGYDAANSRFIAYRPVRMAFTARVTLANLAAPGDVTLALMVDGANYAYAQGSPGNSNGITMTVSDTLNLRPYQVVTVAIYVADGDGATVKGGTVYSSFEGHPV